MTDLFTQIMTNDQMERMIAKGTNVPGILIEHKDNEIEPYYFVSIIFNGQESDSGFEYQNKQWEYYDTPEKLAFANKLYHEAIQAKDTPQVPSKIRSEYKVFLQTRPDICGYVNNTMGPIGEEPDWVTIRYVVHPFKQGETPQEIWWRRTMISKISSNFF